MVETSGGRVDINMLELLGTHTASASIQKLTIYLPDQDRDGQPVQDLQDYIGGIVDILLDINGGATVFYGPQGVWLNPETGEKIHENTVLVYSYIDPKPFVENIGLIISFLFRFGRETNQGEVFFEFDNVAYRIKFPKE